MECHWSTPVNAGFTALSETRLTLRAALSLELESTQERGAVSCYVRGLYNQSDGK